jgi:uncharacterized protein YndB with AHSA1/START domain
MPERRNSTVEDTSAREIVITRVFDAPRDLVFQAWTDPKHLQHWWGPRGFTNTFHEVDIRPGGTWRFTMHGPDGTDYPNWIIFDEIIKPERISYSHGGGREDDDVRHHVTAIFTEQGDKTSITMIMVFATAAERERVVTEYGAIEGGKQTMDRLEEELVKMSGSDIAFVITREFDAPADLVFKVWTQSEHLAQWWGPKGFSMNKCQVDLLPGGMFHYCMRSPDGHEMWGKFVYRDIIPHTRLVFVNSFSDAEGNTVRAPFASDWPLEVLNTLIFSEKDGKTTLKMQGVPIHATEAERTKFKNFHSSMQQGFNGTFDQLAAYMAKERT